MCALAQVDAVIGDLDGRRCLLGTDLEGDAGAAFSATGTQRCHLARPRARPSQKHWKRSAKDFSVPYSALILNDL